MARLDRYNDSSDSNNNLNERPARGSRAGKTEAQKALAERRKGLRRKKSIWGKIGTRFGKDRENKPIREKKGFRISKVKIIGFLVVLILLIIGGYKVYDFVSTFTAVHVTDEGYDHAKKYANHLVINGIDVSEHQAEPINWKKAKYSGVDFVFVRVGYRSTDKGILGVDAKYKEHIEGAKKAGLAVGAYYYSQAINQKEAEEEAAAMLELVDGYDLDLPLVIDYELYKGGRLEKEIAKGNMTTASVYHNIVLAFCKKVEAAGYDSGIYANYDMFTHYMDSAYIEKESNLWIAQYGGSTALKSDYRFWQCSETEKVGGIKKGVDHDFMYLKADGVTKVWYATSPHKTSLEGAKIAFKKDNFKHKSKGVKPKITVVGPDGKKLWKNRDYTVMYANNVHKGTGYVIVKGKGSYRDIVVKSFKIE